MKSMDHVRIGLASSKGAQAVARGIRPGTELAFPHLLRFRQEA